jgi:hypothetical protein
MRSAETRDRRDFVQKKAKKERKRRATRKEARRRGAFLEEGFFRKDRLIDHIFLGDFMDELY